MRVLLMHPNYHSGGAEIAGNWPPAWAAYLAGFLRSGGYDDIHFVGGRVRDERLEDAVLVVGRRGDCKFGADRRSVVVGWLNRGTLHLVPAADWWWLHGLTGHRHATAVRRRLVQEGVSDEQARHGVEVVVGALRAHGAMTRDQLREVLGEDGHIEHRSMVYTEYFLKGTAPTQSCDLHQSRSLFSHVASIFGEGEKNEPPPAAEPEPQPKKRGFFSRIFGRRDKNDKNEKNDKTDRDRDKDQDGDRRR